MTQTGFTQLVALTLLIFLPLAGFAETVYIDDKFRIGLHEDRDIDSPILKLLPAGTALEVIKRDTPFTQVKEPEGSSGWIDNRYLVDAAPGRAQLLQLQEKAAKLEAELTALKSNRETTPAPAETTADPGQLTALMQENADLKQQLQSEKLQSGELQAQAAELRNQLSQENVASPSGTEGADAETTPDETGTVISGLLRFAGTVEWRYFLAGIAICILIGLIGGVYLMDWMSRRRHGGFRI
ncbi:MAG: TIGR04211 family SH3 domain-containing protein [Gammaproteobacteria bacterium]